MLTHMEDFAGRLAALEVSGVAPIPTPSGSGLRCWEFPPLRPRQAAQRFTRLALCVEQAQGSAAFVFGSSLFARSLQKAIAFSPTSRPCRSTCKAGSSVGQAQKLALARGGSRSGSGYGAADQEEEEEEGSSDWAVMHKSRIRWSDHCGTRDKSTPMTLSGESWS